MKRPLFVLLACIFVVMIGFGVVLPVLPFYVERLALASGASRQSIVMHVGLLTAVYALMQLAFAPVWGRLSDQAGRRRLVLMGIGGYVVAQILFGLATSLWLLYAARVLGGILSSALLPVSAAYVADSTSDEERGRGMAWLGTATSLGFVVGPALGGVLSRRDLHFAFRYGHFMIDSFSVPFLAAAGLGLLALLAALRWLPESRPAPAPAAGDAEWAVRSRSVARGLAPLLGLSLIAQFGLAVFEGTFPLYAQAGLNYGPAELGAVFVVCGLVMAVFQVGALGILGGRLGEIGRIGAGFGAAGAGLVLLVTARSRGLVFTFVGLLALGMALISPNLSALISKRGGRRHVGRGLGVQNAANSLGQASGPLLGSALLL
jgi:DHA1 family multidrug resistance protein-like MFS transporter